uniref:Uncharacterized protein n=1 Tax=Manihot esculenta TaxID=3983 RepID=A0A2C9V5F8_MANES
MGSNLARVDTINIVLNEFCISSYKKVNRDKARVFFSKNVSRSNRRLLSNQLRVKGTTDLGKYLGVSLLHCQVRKNTY